MNNIESISSISTYTHMKVREIKIQFEHPTQAYAIAKVVFYLEDGTTDRNSYRSCELTADELASWGEDDSIVTTIIAEKLGLTILSNEG